jgi:O-antigen/teichoic acid export membrane protein
MWLRRSPSVTNVSWGLIDQSFSSATNFGLAVIAGRIAGPDGLGAVYLGFSAYLLILTMQRALVTDPLVVTSAPHTLPERRAAARKALAIVISSAALSTVLFLLFGLLLPASIGVGLLVFVPWLLGALVQDFWRVLLFRDGRGAAAALNDGVWAAAMAVSIPLLLVSHNQWIVTLTWGVGALAAGGLGFRQTGLRPGDPWASARWWKAHAWPLARWFGPDAALLVVQGQVVVFALVAIIGTAGVGGLRAVQALFAPMSLLAQAIAFPGLPMLTTMAATSRSLARTWALRLSALAVGLVLAYLGVLWILPHHLLGAVFGSAFSRFDGLIAPTGVLQLLTAGSFSIGLLVKAEGRGRALLLNRVVVTVITVALTVGLAVTSGLTAAAWGMALATAVGAVGIVLIAFWPPGRRIGLFGSAHR